MNGLKTAVTAAKTTIGGRSGFQLQIGAGPVTAGDYQHGSVATHPRHEGAGATWWHRGTCEIEHDQVESVQKDRQHSERIFTRLRNMEQP
jgi:hypothetical protein